MNGCDHNEALHPTRMDIPLEIREYVIQLLNQTLAFTVDLRSHVKQAGWNVRGKDFFPLQALFTTMASELDAYADLVAERIAVLGGVARGTAHTEAMQSRLAKYPDALMDGHAHVVALAERFAPYARACGGALRSPRMSRMRTLQQSTPTSRAGSISGFGGWKRTSTAEGPARRLHCHRPVRSQARGTRPATSDRSISSATEIHVLADAQTPVPGIHVDTQTAQAWNAWACQRANW